MIYEPLNRWTIGCDQCIISELLFKKYKAQRWKDFCTISQTRFEFIRRKKEKKASLLRVKETRAGEFLVAWLLLELPHVPSNFAVAKLLSTISRAAALFEFLVSNGFVVFDVSLFTTGIFRGLIPFRILINGWNVILFELRQNFLDWLKGL